MLTQHPLAGRTREDGLLLVLRFIFDEVLLLSLVALRLILNPPLYAYSASPRRADTRRWPLLILRYIFDDVLPLSPPKKEKPKESYGNLNFLKDLEDKDLFFSLTYIQTGREIFQYFRFFDYKCTTFYQMMYFFSHNFLLRVPSFPPHTILLTFAVWKTSPKLQPSKNAPNTSPPSMTQ